MLKNINRRILIIHGWEGNSKEHWFLEEKARLEKMGYEVSVPDMPNAFFPRQEEWVKVVGDFQPDKDSILIGYSLGCPTILRYLERTKKKVGKCFLIASPINFLGFLPVKNFFETDFQWKKIKKMAKKFIVINQTKDIFVPLGHGQDLAKKLGVDLIVVEGMDHFYKMDLSLIENNL